ncbi:MAG: serine hydrolase domain-containing protein [Candidatus Aquilonibacter sp.]
MVASPPPFDAVVTPAVDKILIAQKPVGAAVGVVKDGKLVYIKTYGLRNIAKNEPVDDNTRFEIGSVTKQFTAAAVLQLQEAGKLSIDDKLAKYFPTFPHADEVTLRQMLNQVSGLEDYLHHVPPEHLSTGGGLSAVAELVNVPLHFTPGTRWEYSNTNYYVLGKVVEKVSGQSWEAYVREHIFAAAGMTRSAFVDDEPSLDDYAVGYWKGFDSKLPLQPAPLIHNAWAGGAGEIVSTVADMAAWDTALTSGKIVRAVDYTLMSTPPTLPGGSPDTYGMGLGADPLDGHKRIWHNGGSLGSFTMNATYPDDRLDIIVFENSTSGTNPSVVEAAVLESIFPDAAMAAHAAAPGEDLAMRPLILHFLDEAMSGSLQSSELTPSFAKIATRETQKQIAQQFAQLGKPTGVIFKGKDENGNTTIYHYRVEFPTTTVKVDIGFDNKTHLVAGLGFSADILRHPVDRRR